MARSILFKIAGGAWIVSELATATLLIVLADAFITRRRPLSAAAIVATVLQILCLTSLLCLVVGTRHTQDLVKYQSRNHRDSRSLRILVTNFALSLLAAGTTLATLVWTRTVLDDIHENILGRKPWVVLVCSFFFWTTSIIAQIALYATIFYPTAYAMGNSDIPPDTERISFHHPQETSETLRPDTGATYLSNPFREGQEYSTPPATPLTAQGTSSLRSSFTLATRPSSRAAKGFPYQNACPRDSKVLNNSTPTTTNPPTARPSSDSGFDSWDTSSVGPQIRETVLRSSPSIRAGGPNILAPIPGSRSPSPAKALEGPFLLPEPAESSQASQSDTPKSPPSAYLWDTTRPRIRKRSASNDSHHYRQLQQQPPPLPRSPSFALAEDHIHPLFRTSSPTPPPSASPRTTVTAAPGSFAGLLINERTLQRMRSGSCPNSPSPLGQSSLSVFGQASPENQNYFFDAMETLSPKLCADDSDEPDENGDRKMTPPIPDFILGAGARSSFLGFEQRKTSDDIQRTLKEGESGGTSDT